MGRNANPFRNNISHNLVADEARAPVIPIRVQTDLIRVVGRKPIVKIWLNGMQMECLWDTGSMICLMNPTVLQEKFAGVKIHSVEEFLGTGLTLAAANRTELGIVGIALIDFGINVDNVLFQIPFIISNGI